MAAILDTTGAVIRDTAGSAIEDTSPPAPSPGAAAVLAFMTMSAQGAA